jgi:hypothetical protein
MLIIFTSRLCYGLETNGKGLAVFLSTVPPWRIGFPFNFKINHLLTWHHLSVYPLRTPLFPAVVRTQISGQGRGNVPHPRHVPSDIKLF